MSEKLTRKAIAVGAIIAATATPAQAAQTFDRGVVRKNAAEQKTPEVRYQQLAVNLAKRVLSAYDREKKQSGAAADISITDESESTRKQKLVSVYNSVKSGKFATGYSLNATMGVDKRNRPDPNKVTNVDLRVIDHTGFATNKLTSTSDGVTTYTLELRKDIDPKWTSETTYSGNKGDALNAVTNSDFYQFSVDRLAVINNEALSVMNASANEKLAPNLVPRFAKVAPDLTQ